MRSGARNRRADPARWWHDQHRARWRQPGPLGIRERRREGYEIGRGRRRRNRRGEWRRWLGHRWIRGNPRRQRNRGHRRRADGCWCWRRPAGRRRDEGLCAGVGAMRRPAATDLLARWSMGERGPALLERLQRGELQRELFPGCDSVQRTSAPGLRCHRVVAERWRALCLRVRCRKLQRVLCAELDPVPGFAAPDLRCDGELAEPGDGVCERVQRGQLHRLCAKRHAVQWSSTSSLRPDGHVAEHRGTSLPVRLHRWALRGGLQAKVRPV